MLDLAPDHAVEIVATPATGAVEQALRFVIDDAGIALIHGPVGTGKCTAVNMALRREELPITEIDLPVSYTAKEVVRWLHDAIAVTNDLNELPIRDLQDDLVEMLNANPRVVAVRNAERLSREAAAHLQWLHDRPGANWPLVLVGAPSSVRAVERDALLRCRVTQTVAVKPLASNDLVATLQSMHPLLFGPGGDLLLEIDSRVCHGVLANWMHFLRIAFYIRDQAIAAGRDAPLLDRTLAKAVLAKMPSFTHARKSR